MRWEDERYCRLYTRDTITWLRLGWEGQAVLALLFRKVDRAGLLEIGDEDPVAAISFLTGIPEEICAVAWSRLSAGKDPVVTISDEPSRALLIPKFLDAQEANQSDKARQAKHREMAAARKRLTLRNESSQAVMKRHTRSHDVTLSRAVPSRAVPCLTSLTETAGEQAPPPAAEVPAEEPAAAGRIELKPEHKALAAYVRKHWPEIPDSQAAIESWFENFGGSMDLLEQAKLARAWELANGKSKKPAAAFLLGWFRRTGQGPPITTGEHRQQRPTRQSGQVADPPRNAAAMDHRQSEAYVADMQRAAVPMPPEVKARLAAMPAHLRPKAS